MRHPTPGELLELHFGELDTVPRAACEAHARDCAACRALLADAEWAERGLLAGPGDAPPTDGLQRVLAAASVVRAPRGARIAACVLRCWQGVIVVALGYLVFLATWGANYRREPLSAMLEFDQSRVTTPAVVALNETAIEEMTLRDGYRYEQNMTTELGEHPDSREAQAAFREKRKPVFKSE